MAFPTPHAPTSPVGVCGICGQQPSAGVHVNAMTTTRLALTFSHPKTTGPNEVAFEVLQALAAVPGLTLTHEPTIIP